MYTPNGVDLVKVSIFYKSEKTSGQIVQLIKIKTVALEKVFFNNWLWRRCEKF